MSPKIECPKPCDDGPDGTDGGPISNSDPVTGQAGWYDVRVRIRPVGPDEPTETSPRFAEPKCAFA